MVVVTINILVRPPLLPETRHPVGRLVSSLPGGLVCCAVPGLQDADTNKLCVHVCGHNKPTREHPCFCNICNIALPGQGCSEGPIKIVDAAMLKHSPIRIFFSNFSDNLLLYDAYYHAFVLLCIINL